MKSCPSTSFQQTIVCVFKIDLTYFDWRTFCWRKLAYARDLSTTSPGAAPRPTRASEPVRTWSGRITEPCRSSKRAAKNESILSTAAAEQPLEAILRPFEPSCGLHRSPSFGRLSDDGGVRVAGFPARVRLLAGSWAAVPPSHYKPCILRIQAWERNSTRCLVMACESS